MKSLKLRLITNSLIFLTLITSYLSNWNFNQGKDANSLAIIGDSSGPNAVFIAPSNGFYIEIGLILFGLLLLGLSTKKIFTTYKGKKLFLYLGMLYVLPILYLLLRIA